MTFWASFVGAVIGVWCCTALSVLVLLDIAKRMVTKNKVAFISSLIGSRLHAVHCVDVTGRRFRVMPDQLVKALVETQER